MDFILVRLLHSGQKLAVLLITVMLLNGCGSTATPAVSKAAPTTIAGWLELAKSSAKDTRPGYLLEAANLALLQQDYRRARQILGKVAPVNMKQNQFKTLLLAELYITIENYQQAGFHLDQISEWPENGLVFRWLSAKAQVLAGEEQYREAALLLATHFEQFTEQDKPAIARQIWQYLANNKTPIQSEILIPWQQLYTDVATAKSAPGLQLALKKWHSLYPAHPAQMALSEQMRNLFFVSYQAPKQIAVLLPLTGKYRRAGIAIRDGLIQSWFSINEEQPNVRLYDTNTGPIAQIYQQALDDGAEALIGPLLKESVETLLATTEFSVPTLILNRTENPKLSKQLAYFGLPPEAEGEQTAAWMEKNGITHPLLLSTPGVSNKRLIDGFSRYHQEMAEQDENDEPQQETYTQHYLSSPKQFSHQVEEALGITASKDRVNQLNTLIGQKLESQPRSRRDLDAVYIASSPADARLIKSFLEVTVSPFAKRLPIYIGSRSHAGYRSELEKARIGDLAINIAPQVEQLKEQVITQHQGWKESDLRLFAIGYDSLSLVAQMELIRQLPGFTLQGLTGVIRVNEKGNIEVEMPWAEYRNGSLRPLTNVL